MLAEGSFEDARIVLAECLATARAMGNTVALPYVLNSLGKAAQCQDDYETARLLFAESLKRAREQGVKRFMAMPAYNLGCVLLDLGHAPQAELLLVESLALYRDVDDKVNIVACLEALARVGGAKGTPIRAARLFGAAEILRKSVGVPMPPSDCAKYDRAVNHACAQLSAVEWEQAYDDGRTIPLEQAVVEALTGADGRT